MIEAHPLQPGGQTALEVAGRVAAFLGEARSSLDLALYDVRLPGEPGDVVSGALRAAADRGVAVRIAYNADHDERIFPPPPRTEPELIEALPFPTCGIPGIPDLMHHKYVVRDGESVWTGSTNWTTDSWTLQENVIVQVDSPGVAAEYARNFEELWAARDVDRSGHAEPRTLDTDGHQTRAWFTPGHGEALSHRIAKKISQSKRVRICSPVITTAPVLATLAQVIADGKADVAGCVDATQVADVVRQWQANGNVAWKLPLLQQIMAGPFSGKLSEPWEPTSLHNFMHAKLVVTDDVVFTGSFNLSHSGEKNAENVLEIRDVELAERLAGYVDEIRARYPAITPTRSWTAASR